MYISLQNRKKTFFDVHLILSSGIMTPPKKVLIFIWMEKKSTFARVGLPKAECPLKEASL